MKRQDFYYELPEELIAQDPLEDRSSSRLLPRKQSSLTILYAHGTDSHISSDSSDNNPSTQVQDRDLAFSSQMYPCFRLLRSNLFQCWQ